MAEPTIQLGGGNWAGKTDNLLGYYKEGERFYKQEFTFSRSTTGTYTDSEGYIQEMPYNFLQQSNQFDTTWGTSSATISSGESGYDGTNDAWLLTKTGANGGIRQNNTTSGVQTFSFYAKANASTWVKVNNLGSSAYSQANFDLVNGVVGTTAYIIDAKIEDVGSGWYRCITTYDTTLVNIDVRVADSDNVVSGTSGSIYIQNAQLVKGTSAKTYFPTTTRLNMPRVDYLNNSNGSLILEPQRSNLIQRSEEFSNAYWSTSRIETPYIADVVSPDGTLNAYTLEISSGETNGGGVYRSGISISGDNSWSIFAKKKNANYLVLADTSTTTNAVYFDLENGTVGTTYNATGEMQDFGNGWYRCTMKYTLTSSGIKFIYLSNLNGATSAGVQGGDSIYIYGAQLEQGSYPTSIINTSGSSVTRNADACELTNVADRINSSEGVLFAEISALADDSTYKSITINNSTISDRVQISLNSNDIYIGIIKSGVTQVFTSSSVPNITTLQKIAVKYKLNDCQLWVNGMKVVTDTSASMPVGLNQLNFDKADGNDAFYGNVKDLKVYNTALSDSELAALTT
jgi:hypothetical protein